MAAPATCLLSACGLPLAWRNASAWRILDTGFDQGSHFLRTWNAWRDDPQRASLLHYVALTPSAPTLEVLQSVATAQPEWQPLVAELIPQWFGLLPGFHRLTLDAGRVLLTLCVGDTPKLIRQQQFSADSIYLTRAAAETVDWDRWSVKALTSCCHRGTRLAAERASAEVRAALAQCGFEFTSPTDSKDAETSLLSAQFNPKWTLKNTRRAAPLAAELIGTCAVIGAGLAGASVAASLARRGWRVQVLDQAERPAAGASGLPVGLVVPHVSADDCTLSRLSRSGVRLMLHEAQQCLEVGTDWALTGALECRLDGSRGLPVDWPSAGQDWSQPLSQAALAAQSSFALAAALAPDVPLVAHGRAAWLKPARLVEAWLSRPGVTFQPNAKVDSLCQRGEGWALLDAQGKELACADRVVFANATEVLPVLQRLQASQPQWDLGLQHLPPLHGVRGQLSWALHSSTPDARFPPIPVNGAGSVTSGVPSDAGPAWYVGSSYQPDRLPAWPDEQSHAANFRRLQKLLPGLAQQLAPTFARGPINQWKNTRCVSSDRLPLVGPLGATQAPGLWLCVGMGSRGLSFALLCAELLAARWCAEPLPMDASLAQSLEALRAPAERA